MFAWQLFLKPYRDVYLRWISLIIEFITLLIVMMALLFVTERENGSDKDGLASLFVSVVIASLFVILGFMVILTIIGMK